MKKFSKILVSLAVAFMFAGSVSAEKISLPQPKISGGKVLNEVLNERKSVREFYDTELTREQLSQILWAANGVTKHYDGKGHVNPAAMGIYAVDVYAVMKDGIYLYKPEKHSLELVVKGDFRSTTTTGQDFVKVAPLNLVYVENISTWDKSSRPVDRERQPIFANIAAGAMAQSVALAADNESLGNCVRASVDVKAFTKAAKLSAKQKVLFAQTVGDSPLVAKG